MWSQVFIYTVLFFIHPNEPKRCMDDGCQSWVFWYVRVYCTTSITQHLFILYWYCTRHPVSDHDYLLLLLMTITQCFFMDPMRLHIYRTYTLFWFSSLILSDSNSIMQHTMKVAWHRGSIVGNSFQQLLSGNTDSHRNQWQEKTDSDSNSSGSSGSKCAESADSNWNYGTLRTAINWWDSMQKTVVARVFQLQQGVGSTEVQQWEKTLTAKQWQQHRKDRHDWWKMNQ